MTVNGVEQDADPPEHVRVVFELPVDSEGWPPARTERLWAERVGEDTVRLDNIPFFVRGFALGDVVRIVVDDDGVLWAKEAVECSANCTIRIIPAKNGHLEEEHQAVLDAFAPFGVDGEGLSHFGLVALNIPADVDISRVKRLLIQGAASGRWHYEEGCVTPAWRTAE